jgi:exonuclease V
LSNCLFTADQDEILLKTIPEPEADPNSRRKRAPISAQGASRRTNKRRELSPSQFHVTDFFTSPSKASRSPSPKRSIYELSLSDTKTRRSKSLPSDDDALSSRMQLMLYHHLLSKLLSPTFSFSTFWEKVHVDPFAQFSEKFLLETGLARETDGKVVLGYPDCLDDLADLWRSTVNAFRLQAVSPTLEIAYRIQPKRGAAPELSRREVLGYFTAADQEERDLQRAIAESLRDKGGGAEQLSDMPPIRWYTRSGQLESASAQSVAVETARLSGEGSMAKLGLPDSQASAFQPESSNIIGRKTFVYDEAAMQAHVQDVLRWWRGERPPRGVDVEHSRRCL